MYLNPNESSVSEKGKAGLSACMRDSKLRLFKSKDQEKDAKRPDCPEIPLGEGATTVRPGAKHMPSAGGWINKSSRIDKSG